MKVRSVRPASLHASSTVRPDVVSEQPSVRVQPGEYVVSSEPVELVTVLGSCVAACVRDPVTGIGGMNHFMLPDGEGVDGPSARYGSYAMERLLNEILKRGGVRSRLEAKVFGGGNVLKGFTSQPIGDRNARFVRQYLDRECIPIVAEDLQDVHPRKVFYYPATGRALVRRLVLEPSGELLKMDRLYRERLEEGDVNQGSVELFQ